LLLLIKMIFDRVTKAKISTKFDIKIIYYRIYYRIYIRENDKQKTAFRIKYKLYKYLIISFKLINVFASF